MNTLDEYLWGKSVPYKHLRKHMIDAGACASAYLSSVSMAGVLSKLSNLIGTPEHDAIAFVAYLTSLHDLGKASPQFVRSSEERYALIPQEIKRQYFPRSEGLMFRHERESEDAVKRIWTSKGVFDRRTCNTFSAVLGLHHQGKREDVTLPAEYPEWQKAQQRLDARMRLLFCPQLPKVRVTHHDALGAYLVGLIVLCDWVASSDAFDNMPETEDDEAYRDVAAERAGSALRAYGLIGDTPFPRIDDFFTLWPSIPVSNMRPVQSACVEAARRHARLTIIEAPMGEGKSETALYIASKLVNALRLQGIYMAMPTAATSNQMYERFRAMLDNLGGAHSIRLLHSLAWLLDEQPPEPRDFHLDNAMDGDAQSASSWLAPLRRGLLAENAVGTVDQAMAAVLYRKYGLLRLTGLAGKVLIIDEIHAYDVYMGEIIERLLTWCGALGVPVILLSATLQKAQKARYLACYRIREDEPISGAYPLITQVDGRGDLVETPVGGVFMKSRFLLRVLPVMDDPKEIARRAVDRAKGGGCLCVMLNTVEKAQKVYRAIKAIEPDGVHLFHARFLNARRAEIEKKCVALFGKDAGEDRPKRAILVCTQVVEQSLDVDFDGMMTELAPIDLILQRAGRVHRHRDRTRPAGFEEPVIDALVPDGDAPADRRYGATGAVYDAYILARTEELLHETLEIRVPEDVRQVIEKVYSGLSPELIEDFIRRQTGEEMMKIAAEAVVFPRPCADRFFGSSRIISGRFERPDEDDAGFRIVKGASTRYGSDSVRVAFLDDGLFSAARKERMSEQEQISILKRTCSINLRSILEDVMLHTSDDKEGEISYIKTGHLNGYCAVRTVEGIARIGEHVLHVDNEMGIWMGE